MHTTTTGGSSRSTIHTFIADAFVDRRLALPASLRETTSGQLTREDLRHLVAAMVD